MTNEYRIGEWPTGRNANVAPPQTLVLIACSRRAVVDRLIEPLRQAVPECSIEVAEVSYPGDPAVVRVARYKSLMLKASRFLRSSVWLRKLMRRIPAAVAGRVAFWTLRFLDRPVHQPPDRPQRLRRWLSHAWEGDVVFVICDPPISLVDDLALTLLDPHERPAVTIALSTAGQQIAGLERSIRRLARLGAAAPPVVEIPDGAAAPALAVAVAGAQSARRAVPPSPVLVIADRFLLEEPAGNVAVFQRQLAYLAARGHVVVLAVPEMGDRDDAPRLDGALEKFPIIALETIDLRVKNVRRQYDRAAQSGIGWLGVRAELYRDVATSPALARLARADRFAFAIANYFWTLRLLDPLCFDAPVVCETIDIQAFQYSTQRREPVHEGDLALELSLLGRADALIAISDSEEKFLAERFPPGRVHYNVGGFDPPEESTGFGLDSPLSKVLAAAGPSRHVPELPPTARLDVLFIGHRNIHNLRALAWLLEEVLPRIRRECRVIIAGTIADRPEAAALASHPGVHLLGVVRDLAPLYAAARLVAVPLLSGEGTSIKTIEAMAYGKALATTSAGLRGMGPIDYPRADGTEEYAALVNRILEDSEFRTILEKRSREIASHFSTDKYFYRFDSIIKAAGIAWKDRCGKPDTVTTSSRTRHCRAGGDVVHSGDGRSSD